MCASWVCGVPLRQPEAAVYVLFGGNRQPGLCCGYVDTDSQPRGCATSIIGAGSILDSRPLREASCEAGRGGNVVIM